MGAEAVHAALTTPYVKKLLRAKARQLICRPGFSQSDRLDVEQDLAVHIVAKADLYNPARGSVNTFISRIVDSAVAMMLRRRGRLKRAAGLVAASLETTFIEHQGDVTPLSELIDDDDLARRMGTPTTPDQEQHLGQLDVATALAGLPPELQDIARRLTSRTESGIARDLGISRRQVRNAVAAIREHLEAAGFGRT